MNYYIASSLGNRERVRRVAAMMNANGFTQTYDWTVHEHVTAEQLPLIGTLEKEAVLAADFLIVLMPAGKGSHVEFGLALAHDKPIYLYSETEIADPSSFYYVDGVHVVTGEILPFLERVIHEQRGESVAEWLREQGVVNDDIYFIESLLTFAATIRVVANKSADINERLRSSFPNHRVHITPQLTVEQFETILRDNEIEVDVQAVLQRYRHQGICVELCREWLQGIRE